MVKVSEDGTVESVFEEFGKKTSSFNPVYDEAPDIGTRIVDDSCAPFASGGMFDSTVKSQPHVHRSGHNDCCGDDDDDHEMLAGL